MGGPEPWDGGRPQPRAQRGSKRDSCTLVPPQGEPGLPGPPGEKGEAGDEVSTHSPPPLPPTHRQSSRPKLTLFVPLNPRETPDRTVPPERG